MNRVRNEEVHRRAGIERELAMVWDMERMDEYRMARRALMVEVSGGRVRGMPMLGWMDGVKATLGNRSADVGCTTIRKR